MSSHRVVRSILSLLFVFALSITYISPIPAAVAQGDDPTGHSLYMPFVTNVPIPTVSDQGVTDFGLLPFYGQTGWVSAHRDSRNSDYAPFVMPSKLKLKWNALEREGDIPGSATFFGPTQGVDGGLWQHSGRGTGFSHFHKIDPDTGEILFETDPWQGECLLYEECLNQDPSTPDNAAVGQAPLVDVDGNVYIADFDQYWSFDKDGKQRWVVHFADLFTPIGAVTASFVSSIITTEGFVGGITTDCHLVLLNREDGTLAVPILKIPCGPTVNTPGIAALDFLWYPDGEVYFPFREIILEGLFGSGPPNVNTPSVNPQTGRIFFVHADVTDPDNHDAVTAIDLVDDGAGGKVALIVWSTQIGADSGASVAISPDGKSVYTVDGDATIWGLDAETGDVIFSTAGSGQAAASPTVGPDGNLYAAGTTVLVSLDPTDGSTRWSTSYQTLASAMLPELEPTESDFLVPDGTPVADVIDVVSISENKVWTNVVLGYDFYGLIPMLEALGLPPTPMIIPHINLLVAADPDTGKIIDESIITYDGGNEGLTELNPDGSIYISKADILVSPFYWTFNQVLPERFRTPSIPKGGITAFEPASYHEFSLEGVASVQKQIARALGQLPNGDLQDAFTQVRRGRMQLGFTATSVHDAADRDEIPQQKADAVRDLLLEAAAGPMTDAYDLLLKAEHSANDLADAQTALNAANTLLDSAAAELQ